MDPRSTAAKVLAETIAKGRPLDRALTTTLVQKKAGGQRGLVQELGYGVCRWYHRLRLIADVLLERPLRRKDSDVYSLILVGLYQLSELHTPPHVAVSASAGAARDLGKPWAVGVVNAVLRGYVRRKDQFSDLVSRSPEAHYSHPLWLQDAIRKAWPQQWEDILKANNARPPMTLRVNRLRSSRDAYLLRLTSSGIAAHPAPHTPEGVILEKPMAVEALPGFTEGVVSVQDAAAQLAARLLDLREGHRVLDACAAPGGKATHIVELCPNLQETIAADLDAERLKRLQDNLTRLGLADRVEIVCTDAANTLTTQIDGPFDRVLLDAPCSGTGVIRRHPDIKLLRRPEDLAPLAARQHELLMALWPLVKPGGMLLYATCSVLPAENARIVEQFIHMQGDATPDRLDANWGQETGPGRQILPGTDQMDGFYYARLRKD